MELPDETVQQLLSLASVPLAHRDPAEALEAICRIAEMALADVDGASLTTVQAVGPEAVASSNEWARHLDEMQYVEREGPCIDAARTGALFRVPDMGDEPRWPSYMPQARATGAASMVSIPMAAESKTVGALNLYSRRVGAFDAELVSLGEILAGHAGLAMQIASTLHGHRDVADQLRAAMESRAAIEQAKGVIMATVGCDPDTAFERLVEQSQHENRKLREVAADLVRRQDRRGAATG